MFTRLNPKDGRTVSVLGMGCMRLPTTEDEKIDFARAEQIIDYAYAHGVNYFDTAYPYHNGQSEAFTGRALKKYPRESFLLATKLPGWKLTCAEDVERIFNEQLNNCGVSFFDYYLLHAINEKSFEENYERFRAYDTLLSLKKQGLIRNLGFSFHDKPEVLKEVLYRHEWDFVQIQLNYMDWEMQDAKTQYEMIREYGAPCIVMEPVRGGALASLSEGANALLKEAAPERSVASWAIRYAAGLENVLTVLSGMSNMEQVIDNVSTMERFEPLNENERCALTQALELHKQNVTIPCTGCRYCMDCPSGVDIPGVFKLYNAFQLSKLRGDFIKKYKAMEETARASSCIGCKKCVDECPQHISIPEMMQKVRLAVDE